VRAEPLYQLARLLKRAQGASDRLPVRGCRPHRSPALGSAVLDASVYRWRMLFKFSVAAYWADDVPGALRACKHLLTPEDLPDEFRRQTRANLQYCVAASVRAPTPVAR